jgi:hypothetical protein
MRSTTTRTTGAALVAALTAGLGLTATQAQAASATAATQAAWERVTAASQSAPGAVRVAPRRFAAFRLDPKRLATALAAAPRPGAGGEALSISVPTPSGGFERFAVRGTAVMEPRLAADHPEIRTFTGRSLDRRGRSIRLELTPLGLTAATRGAGPSTYVDPRFSGDATDHVAYERSALPDPRAEEGFVERELGDEFSRKVATRAAARTAGDPVTVKTYRLALVSDPSYAANNGATGNTLAAKAVLMSRVNQLYETDLAIRMLLIDETPKLNLDTNADATGANGPCGATPCFTTEDLSGCTGELLDRNTVVAGLLVDARDFEIGHIVLGKNGGGIAGLGVVGRADKSTGCTGIPRPVGDAFAVDYVAHEMGHQFSGNHTFAGDQLNCAAPNRNAYTGVEPGSGTTVMAYAGICAQDNLQPHSDPVFSQRSIDEITTYTSEPEDALSSVQQAAFRNLNGTEQYLVTYDGGTPSAPLRATSTAAQIKAAIQSVLPAGGTVTVSAASATGWTATFGGTLAGKAVGLLGVTAFTGDASGFVGEITAGGPTRRQGTAVPTANRVPGVTTAPSHTIPKQTPFTLTASGSDADGDPISYLWEQNDTTPGADPVTGTGPGTLLVNNTKTTGPLFRVFGTAARYPEADAYLQPSPGENVPTADPSRSFPDVAQVMADNTNAQTGSCPTVTPSQYAPLTGDLISQGGTVSDEVADCLSEFLPTNDYTGSDGLGTMHFRVTVRDNEAGAGGTALADTQVAVAKGAGPFRITAPARNRVYPIGGEVPVTWAVAQTNVAPVSTPTVRISLSTDAGKTFATVLAAATPNDGAETVRLPAGLSAEEARIRIDAVDNVFFDVSRGNISIVDASQPPAGSGGGGQGGTTPPAGPGTGGSGGEGTPAAGGGTPAAGGTTPGPATTITTTTTKEVARPLSAQLRAFALAAQALRRTPTFLGRIGDVSLYATSTSSRLSRALPSRRLYVAVCTTRPCTVATTAVLRTVERRTGKVRRVRLNLGTLRLKAESARSVTLRLTAAQRRTVRGSRAATLVVTTTSGKLKRSRTYRLAAK